MSVNSEGEGSQMGVRCLLASLAIVNLVVCFASIGKASPAKYPVKLQINVKVPMRDGVNLSAKIYRPDAPGKFPGLLMRTYHSGGTDMAAYLAQLGYAVALVDVRGRYDSDGVWEFYVNEPRDGYDTQQWLGQQSWCNGEIGTFGHSYNGFTQLMPAPLRCPYVKCLVPSSAQQTNFGHIYNDGVMQLNMVFTAGLFGAGRTLQPTIAGVYGGVPILNYDELFRRLPLISALDDISDLPHVRDWIRHPKYDDYWKAYGIKDKYGEINVPAYFITGWYDNLVHETFRNFKGFRKQGGSPEAREGAKIIAGPWTHAINHIGKEWAVDFGSDASIDINDLHIRWYDFWLKDIKNGIDQEPPVKIFVMGHNKWRFENEWPLARTQFTNYYLHSDGKANSLHGDGTLSTSLPQKNEPQDLYVYDPENPVPTLGGQISTHPELQGPRDRRPVQKRDDVLVYTSAPLREDLEVTGPVEVKLYASSSTVDTDFTATLTDVHPDGSAIHVCEGIRGARFRESLENPTLIEPGKVYEYIISLWETSNVFKVGHRIRLEISSSNFPRYARNQNTGHPFGLSAEMKTAKQTIYHDALYPSHLILPVIPE